MIEVNTVDCLCAMLIIVSLQEVIYDIRDVSQFGGFSLQSCVTAV